MTLRYQRKCFKIRYDTRGAAKKAMGSINKELGRKADRKLKSSYYCEECAGWHLTSMEKERSRAITQSAKA